jgi:AcrR family transcriptional regulator
MVTQVPNSKSRAGKKQISQQDLRRAILDATLEECAVAGPQEVSFREIARRLGVTTAAPYYHFRDKEEIFGILHIEGFAKLLEALERGEAKGRTYAEKIKAMAVAYLNFGRKERGYYSIMFYREETKPLRCGPHKGLGLPCFDFICAGIARAKPTLTSNEVSERAVSVWSFLHGMLVLSSAGPLSRLLAPAHEDRLAAEVCNRIIGTSDTPSQTT